MTDVAPDDNSPQMLELIRGAETVLGDIESLDLGRRFPVVVLASNFVNQPVPQGAQRVSRVVCQARRVPDGQVLLQAFPRGWTPRTDWTEHGEVRLRLRRFTLVDGIVSGEMEYVVGGRRRLHEFESKLLSPDELDEDLRAVGLRRERELDDAGSWIEAVPFPS